MTDGLGSSNDLESDEAGPVKSLLSRRLWNLDPSGIHGRIRQTRRGFSFEVDLVFKLP